MDTVDVNLSDTDTPDTNPSDTDTALHTVPVDPSPRWDRFERWLRAFTFAGVFGVVALALVGVAGVRSDTASATSDQVRVTVRHASVSRPGLATPFSVAVESIGDRGLPSTLHIRVPDRFLALFDENGLHPTPDAESSDGTTRTWTYELAPSTTRFALDLDARLQPSVHRGADATVEVEGTFEDGDRLDTVEVHLSMSVLP